MKRFTLAPQLAILFLLPALILPATSYALRQESVRDAPPLEQDLRAGLEGTVSKELQSFPPDLEVRKETIIEPIQRPLSVPQAARLTSQEKTTLRKIFQEKRKLTRGMTRQIPRQPASGVFHPTPPFRLAMALKFVGVKTGEIFRDLGSGEGDALFVASGLFGVQGIGMETDPYRYEKSQRALVGLEKGGFIPSGLIRLIPADFLSQSWADADYLYYFSFGGSPSKTEIVDKAIRELKPGAKFLLLGIPVRHMREIHYEDFRGLTDSGDFTLTRLPALSMLVFTRTKKSLVPTPEAPGSDRARLEGQVAQAVVAAEETAVAGGHVVVLESAALSDSALAAVAARMGASEILKRRIILWREPAIEIALPVAVTGADLLNWLADIRERDPSVSRLTFVGLKGSVPFIEPIIPKEIDFVPMDPSVASVLIGLGVPQSQAMELAAGIKQEEALGSQL